MQTKAWLVVAGIAAAWDGPKVEYSADSCMETADMTMQGRVYSARGKERREYIESGEKMVMIMRHDKKVVWILMPEDKSYMVMESPKEGRKDSLGGSRLLHHQLHHRERPHAHLRPRPALGEDCAAQWCAPQRHLRARRLPRRQCASPRAACDGKLTVYVGVQAKAEAGGVGVEGKAGGYIEFNGNGDITGYGRQREASASASVSPGKIGSEASVSTGAEKQIYQNKTPSLSPSRDD